MIPNPRRLDPRAETYAMICSILPSLVPADIDESEHLKALGADSVDRVEIIMGLMQRLDLREPLSTFSDVPDVGSLIQVLEGLQRSQA